MSDFFEAEQQIGMLNRYKSGDLGSLDAADRKQLKGESWSEKARNTVKIARANGFWAHQAITDGKDVFEPKVVFMGYVDGTRKSWGRLLDVGGDTNEQVIKVFEQYLKEGVLDPQKDVILIDRGAGVLDYLDKPQKTGTSMIYPTRIGEESGIVSFRNEHFINQLYPALKEFGVRVVFDGEEFQLMGAESVDAEEAVEKGGDYLMHTRTKYNQLMRSVINNSIRPALLESEGAEFQLADVRTVFLRLESCLPYRTPHLILVPKDLESYNHR